MNVAQPYTDHTKIDIYIRARDLNECQGCWVVFSMLDFCAVNVTAFFVNFFIHSPG